MHIHEAIERVKPSTRPVSNCDLAEKRERKSSERDKR